MFWTRKAGRTHARLQFARAAAVSTLPLVLLAGVGCQPKPQPEVARDDIAPDEAMAHRDWTPSTAYYPSGGVEAGSTRQWYRPREDRPEWQHAALDPLMFVAQTLALPFTYITTPWGTAETHGGFDAPPSYTGIAAMASAETDGAADDAGMTEGDAASEGGGAAEEAEEETVPQPEPADQPAGQMDADGPTPQPLDEDVAPGRRGEVDADDRGGDAPDSDADVVDEVAPIPENGDADEGMEPAPSDGGGAGGELNK